MTGVKDFEDCYDHRRDIFVDTKDCNYQYCKECFTPEHLYEYDSYFKKVGLKDKKDAEISVTY
jgi:hypothetical protein